MCPGGGLADLQLAGGAGFHDQAVPPGHCGQVATRTGEDLAKVTCQASHQRQHFKLPKLPRTSSETFKLGLFER